MTVTLTNLPLSALVPAEDNVRGSLDASATKELAASILGVGLLTPLRVTKNGIGYKIIAGHRRHAAMTHLVETGEWQADVEVPVVIEADVTDATRLAQMVVENTQRVDITPIEEAQGYLRLASEFSWSSKEIGLKVGRSKTHVDRRMALLTLPEVLQQALVNDQITLDTAYTLTTIDEDLLKKIEVGYVKNKRVDDWEVRAAVSRTTRRHEAAALDKALERAMITTSTEWPGTKEHDRIGSFTAKTLKDYTPKRNDVVYRPDGSADVVVFRKLTAKQIEERDTAAAAERQELGNVPQDDSLYGVWTRQCVELEEQYDRALEEYDHTEMVAFSDALRSLPKATAVSTALSDTFRRLDFDHVAIEVFDVPKEPDETVREAMLDWAGNDIHRMAQAIILWGAHYRYLDGPAHELRRKATSHLTMPEEPEYPVQPEQDADGNWFIPGAETPEADAVRDDELLDEEQDDQPNYGDLEPF